MYIQTSKSKALKKFLKDSGIMVQKSACALNTLTLKNVNTGEEITIWAELESSALGLPGLYIDEGK